MAQLQIVSTGGVITVADQPQWVKGVWECGDQRFTDPAQTLYVAVAAPASFAKLTPMQFYLAFTLAERIAIKASTDPVVKEFWATYELAAQTATPIDPNLVGVVEGLGYLAAATTATPPGAGILASTARIAQIQAGVAQ